MDTTHYKQDTPKMHDRITLRVRLIHASIVPSFSPSRKPLGPFGPLKLSFLPRGIRPPWRCSCTIPLVSSILILIGIRHLQYLQSCDRRSGLIARVGLAREDLFCAMILHVADLNGIPTDDGNR